MTASTKSEVLSSEEDRATTTSNISRYASGQTDKQTDSLIAILCNATGGELIICYIFSDIGFITADVSVFTINGS